MLVVYPTLSLEVAQQLRLWMGHENKLREAIKKNKVLNFGHWPNLSDPPPKLWTPYLILSVYQAVLNTRQHWFGQLVSLKSSTFFYGFP